MFVSSVLIRRFRVRRLRRSAARFASKLDFVGLSDLDDMLVDLCIWAAGMPWVVETPCGARGTLKLFMLECSPLSCHEPWFAINPMDGGSEDRPGVLVILPDAMADRATTIGHAAGIEPIGRGRSVTAIGLPISGSEFEALQRLLEVTYTAAFEPSS
jgi:hypothetical protein